jgi:hypothetical protein
MLEMGLFEPIPILLEGDPSPSPVDLLFLSLPRSRREERDGEAHSYSGQVTRS